MTTLEHLLRAEARARELFAECTRRGFVVPGKTESAISDEIAELADEMFGVKKFWHKRIVRAGRNTLLPYDANPPEHTLAADDILFCDFGPIFEEWEADVGFTVVLGDDRNKRALADDTARIWEAGLAYFKTRPNLTAAQLYAHTCELARAAGWEFGHIHCGHVVGKFPHERDAEGDTELMTASNHRPLRRPGQDGEPLRWILEVHLVDRDAGIGGFQEALLVE
ncbi:M24 family metallopeptidase [soil metagenome]